MLGDGSRRRKAVEGAMAEPGNPVGMVLVGLGPVRLVGLMPLREVGLGPDREDGGGRWLVMLFPRLLPAPPFKATGGGWLRPGVVVCGEGDGPLKFRYERAGEGAATGD